MAKHDTTDQFVNLIGAGTRLKGDVVFDADVFIDGSVEGRLDVQGKLVLGENADVRADTTARELEVRGRVKGNVACAGLLRLTRTAQLTGDVRAGSLAVEEGATLSGNLAMGEGADPPAVSKK
jgi:cytoskeletal protein CcmA (bactofilin family)